MTRSRSRAATSISLVLAFLVGYTALAVSAHAAGPPPADYLVNTNSDGPDFNPGDNVCSTGNFIGESETQECTLRAAIQETNADPGAQTIAVTGGLGPITLTTTAAAISPPGTEDASDENSDLDITETVTITCFNPTNDPFGPCSVDGAHRGRVLDIHNAPTVTITTEGSDAGWDLFSGLPSGDDGINGGGIRVLDDGATLDLHNTTVGDFEGAGNGNVTGAVQTNAGFGGCDPNTNSACTYQAGDGGGLFVGGADVTVTLDNSNVNYNSSGGTDQQDPNCGVYYTCNFLGGDGGGIALEGARDSITASGPSLWAIAGNTTVGSGDAVQPSPCPSGCAPNTYSAGDGAGLFTEGVDTSVTMTNVVFGDNDAGSGYGGAIENVGDNATFEFHDSYIGLFGEDIQGNNAGYGGGIANNPATYSGGEEGISENGLNAEMSFDNTLISSNTATQGGGIYNTGQLFVSMTNRSVIGGPDQTDGNSASGAVRGGAGEGGGIFNGPFGEVSVGSLTLSDVVIENNTASDVGGGIANLFGDVHMTGSTVIANASTHDGGGIWNGGTFGSTGEETDVINNTIANNTAGGRGGATFNASFGVASFKNMTIADNVAQGNVEQIDRVDRGRRAPTIAQAPGDNLYNAALAQDEGGFGTFVLQMDIISGGASANCSGAFFSATHNIDSDGTCGLNSQGDMVVDPLLGTLGFYDGGPTPVFNLLGASPAIDRGNTEEGVCPAVDQTKKTRPQDGNGDGSAVCDIGAYELAGGRGGGGGGGGPAPTPSATESPTASSSASPTGCLPHTETPSPTTTPFPSPSECEIFHATSEISLGFRTATGGTLAPVAAARRSGVNGVFFGHVTSKADGCIPGRRVRLLKLKHGRKKFLARTNTNAKGAFHFRRHNVHGTFYARVKRKSLAANFVCDPASSPTVHIPRR